MVPAGEAAIGRSRDSLKPRFAEPWRFAKRGRPIDSLRNLVFHQTGSTDYRKRALTAAVVNPNYPRRTTAGSLLYLSAR